MARRVTLTIVFGGLLCAFFAVMGWGPGAPVAQAQPLAGAFTNCAAQTQIPQVECEALVALYNGTNGPGWTTKTNWLATDVPCAWFGVTCDAGHVSRLYLFNNQLSGSIPAQLGNLSNLIRLDLPYNQLTGSIPGDLGSLASLQALGLDHNQLSGSIPTDLGKLSMLEVLGLANNSLSGNIPAWLGSLPLLRHLWLDNNQFSGEIPPELGKLSHLERLLLWDNQLAGAIPPELGNLSNLQYLYLSSNHLTGGIPADLGNLSSLQYLYLTGNPLTGGVPVELGNLSSLLQLALGDNQLTGSIPAELGKLSNLQSLELWSNQLTGSIPAELGNLSNLQRLYLDNNQLTGSVPADLGKLSNLQHLWLQDNCLTGSIPAELGNLSGVEHFYLYRNQLTGSIPAALGNLSNVQFLFLHSNLLSGSIPSELGSLSNLQGLDLNSNQLAGDIPTSLANLVNLDAAYTDLGYNKLTAREPPLLTFLATKDPDWAATQTVPPTDVDAAPASPTSIQLTWTPIIYSGDGGYYEIYVATTAGGPYTLHGVTANKSATGYLADGLTAGQPYHFVVQTFTPAHGNQQNDLWSGVSAEVSATPLAGAFTNCAAQTQIPQVECEALVALYNGTNGPGWTTKTNWLATDEPCGWFGVTCDAGHVIRLAFLSNQLSGSIPLQLGNLSALQYLYLSGNQLSGSIPAELGNLGNLEYLDLLYNQLSGSIPAALGNLSYLLFLTLGGNQLSGSIPAELGSMSSLQVLEAGGNQLSGSIPAELGGMSSLHTLSLIANQLSGSIPATLGNLSALDELDLRMNALAGDIPPSFVNLAALTYLALDYNMLTASDPTLITFLAGLEPDWAATQTLTPADVVAAPLSTTAIELTWTPIAYTGGGGYYEVSYATSLDGPYSVHGVTLDKSAAGYVAGGLTGNTPYYFRVRTFTPPIGVQRNNLWSDYSPAKLARTDAAGAYLRRINCGGDAYTDTGGRTWSADKPFTTGTWGFAGGSRVATGASIANTTDDPLYKTDRTWTASARPGYRFSVPNGAYEVTFKFAETQKTAVGQRKFTVRIEGIQVLTRYDIYSVAGAKDKAVADRIFVINVSDGELDIEFIKVIDNPKVNAIQVKRLTSYELMVNCGGSLYTDSAGKNWRSDKNYGPGSWGYTGGAVRTTTAAIANTVDDTLYQSERQWSSSAAPGYRFAVPNGTYDVTFKFAETAYNAAGLRVFGIKLEGVTRLSNYDIFAAAGAKNRAAADQVFTVQVTDGELTMDFVQGVGAPKVNAIRLKRIGD